MSIDLILETGARTLVQILDGVSQNYFNKIINEFQNEIVN